MSKETFKVYGPDYPAEVFSKPFDLRQVKTFLFESFVIQNGKVQYLSKMGWFRRKILRFRSKTWIPWIAKAVRWGCGSDSDKDVVVVELISIRGCLKLVYVFDSLSDFGKTADLSYFIDLATAEFSND
jgi:hypothetical protein